MILRHRMNLFEESEDEELSPREQREQRRSADWIAQSILQRRGLTRPQVIKLCEKYSGRITQPYVTRQFKTIPVNWNS